MNRYIAVLADCGPFRGSWVVIRRIDGSLWSEDFATRTAAEDYADYLNSI